MPLPFSCQEFESITQKSAVFYELIDIKLSFKFFFFFKVNVLFIPTRIRFAELAQLGKQVFNPFRFIVRLNFLSCVDCFVCLFKKIVISCIFLDGVNLRLSSIKFFYQILLQRPYKGKRKYHQEEEFNDCLKTTDVIHPVCNTVNSSMGVGLVMAHLNHQSIY